MKCRICLILLGISFFHPRIVDAGECNWIQRLLRPMLGDSEMIHAPAKKPLQIRVGDHRGSKVELFSKETNELVSTHPLSRIESSKTDLGRISGALDRQGIVLLTEKARFGPKGAFVDVKIAHESSNGNGVILINSNLSGKSNLRSVLGHEAYHARMNLKRLRNEKDPFNSEFISRSNDGGIYDRYLSSEEIHAWSKEFQQVAIRAHHRETLQLIKNGMQKMPSSLSKEEKLLKIELKTSSVIDPGFEKFRKEYEQVLETHEHYLDQLSVKLEMGDFKLKFDDLDHVLIETDSFVFRASNFKKLPNGSADVLGIRKEVEALRKTDFELRKKLSSVHQQIIAFQNKGKMNGREYLRLKDEIAALSSAVTVKNASSLKVRRYGNSDESWKAKVLEHRYSDDGYVLDPARPDREVVETDWAYHGTSSRFFSSIQQHGIDHSKGVTVNGGKMKTNQGAASTRSVVIADYFSKRTSGRVGDEAVIFRWKTAVKGSVNESDLAPPVPSDRLEYSLDGGNAWFKLDRVDLNKAKSALRKLETSNEGFNIPVTSPIFSDGRLRVRGNSPTIKDFDQEFRNAFSSDELKRLNHSILAHPTDSRVLSESGLMALKSEGFASVPLYEKNHLRSASVQNGFPVIIGLNPQRSFSVGASSSEVRNMLLVNSGLNDREIRTFFVPKEKIPEVKEWIRKTFGEKGDHMVVEDIRIFESAGH